MAGTVADLKRARNMTKHENDIYLIAVPLTRAH